MRILLATGIYPPESGGPATYTAGLASALRSQGHSVRVLAYGDRSSSDNDVTRVSRRGGALVRYVRYAWRTFLLARKSDLVYAQGPVSEGVPATIGAALAGRPLTMKMVGDYAWEMAMQRGEKDLLDVFLQKRHTGVVGLYEGLERWTARRAQRLIVPSRYLATVVEQWGVAKERVHVIVNAPESFVSLPKRAEERKRFGVSDSVVILSAVRAVPWKGIAELILGMKSLPAKHLLVVAGDGPELAKWKALAEQESVQSRVRFLGRVDRATLTSWYVAADAFALNSGYEGYPHTVAEAASIGLPCFVSDQGGNVETKDQFGDLVRMVPYANQEAWVKALSGVTKREGAPVFSTPVTHAEMTQQTLTVLEGKKDPLSVVMVSYDRALLDASSDVFARVSDLAVEDTSIHALVVSRSVTPVSIQKNGFSTVGFSGSSFFRMLRAVRMGIRLVRHARNASLVTAQDPFAAGLVGYLISRFANVPLEIQEHGDFYSGFWKREAWTHRVFALLGLYILRRAERVRAVSERVKAHLVAKGVSAERIEIIPVAQSLGHLFDRAENVAAPMRLVAPCRFVEQKGLDALLEAAKLLLDRNVPFQLSLIGSGPLEPSLKKQIAENGLSDRVRIEAWRDPARVWNEADLLVLSSRYEGWGRTIVEAMAAGVAIVATDTGCVGSFFRPQIDGRVVQPNDPIALADAIQGQIEEPERRILMCKNAREQARTFPAADVLRDTQVRGWRSMFASLRNPGPRFELYVIAFIGFIILSRLVSAGLFHGSLIYRERGFFTLVEHWFQGFGYSYAQELGCASAYRAPGYLFFLTALYSVFSPTNTLAQALVQNLFVVGVLWLVYVVGSRLVGKRAALIGALLMACYPYTFYHYSQYYHTFLSSFFLLLLVWFVFRLTETKSYRYAIGAGLSIGGLAYMQGTILPATPLIALWVFWKFWPEWKRGVFAVALMAIFAAGLIAPWTYRNWKQLHAFVPLTTDLGYGFFKANNEVIYELTKRGYPQEVVDVITVSSTNPEYRQFRMPVELEDQFKTDGVYRDSIYWTEWHPVEPAAKVVATCAELGPLNEVEFNKYWMEKGSAWLSGNWWPEGVKLQLLKLKTFWQPSLFPSVKMGAPWSFADSPLKVWLARNVMTLASMVVIYGGFFGIAYHLYRRKRSVVLILGILIVYTLLHTFFAGYTKYRIPLDNLLAPYAGWALVALWRRIRGHRLEADKDVT